MTRSRGNFHGDTVTRSRLVAQAGNTEIRDEDEDDVWARLIVRCGFGRVRRRSYLAIRDRKRSCGFVQPTRARGSALWRKRYSEINRVAWFLAARGVVRQ